MQRASCLASQEELREILIERGYSLQSDMSRMYLVAILDNAFPHKAPGEEEEELLAREVHHLAHHVHHEHHE